MGIAERARDVLRPTNSIESVLEPAKPAQPVLHGARHNGSAEPASAPSADLPGTDLAVQPAKRPAYASEPENIAKAFYVEEKGGERRYFEDYKRTNLAMRATGTSVMSKREDLNTIRAMFEIAEARGWHSVDIKGSAEFRREAWIEATARGLEGRGFTPSDLERQEADCRRAERPQANKVSSIEPPAGAPEKLAAHRPRAATAHEKAEAKPGELPASMTPNDNRRTIREAQKELSEDGRVMLAALSEKIDRQMNRHNSESKAEMKAFVAASLVKKERAEGPIVFSTDQKRAATAPQPVQTAPKLAESAPVSRLEPEPQRRTLSR